MNIKPILNNDQWYIFLQTLTKEITLVDYIRLTETYLDYSVKEIKSLDSTIRHKNLAAKGQYYQMADDLLTITYRLIVGFKWFTKTPQYVEIVNHICIRYNAARKRYLDKRKKQL